MSIFVSKTFKIKQLAACIKYNAGRNMSGGITVFSRGGRQKRKYRFVDFWRRLELQGVVLKLLKDTYRTSHLALILYSNGCLSYMLAVEGLYQGKFIFSGYK